MIIFRFSCVAFLFLANCADEPSSVEQAQPTIRYEFKVLRDGKVVDPAVLLKDRAENPNKVVVDNDGREWGVDGKVLTIREFDPVLDEISGFGVPLKVSNVLKIPNWVSQDGIERISPIQDVTVHMMDYDLQKAATLKVGQEMKVSCDGLRSFNRTLIFDGCRDRK